MAKEKQSLSENLEDYLETISSLSKKDGQVRPSDIARQMKVKRPSVTSALNSLSEKGLVEYEKYKPVVLTKQGQKHATDIQKKHTLLRDFFTDILGVEASEADLAACKMEHALADGLMHKLTHFLKGLANPCQNCPSVNTGACVGCKNCSTSLADLKKGEAGVILYIDKSLGDLACYAGMGLVIGSRVEIVRVAPLGDPVIISVKGTEISLRKAQLGSIRVKRA